MYTKKRGYYFKKKEQKRDGHAWRCKKHARFFDKEAGTFWGLPLDKPWFICSFYKGEIMTEEDKKDEEIINAFIDMIKRKGWEPMEAEDSMAWFGGKTHYQLSDYLPEEAIDKHNHEDIDFLVVGWRAEEEVDEDTLPERKY
jgi:hypothetical protein